MGAAIREQLRRQRWRVQVLVHIGGALAYSIVHTAAMMVLRAALLARTGLPQNFPGWWNYTLMQYLTQLDWLLDDVSVPRRPRATRSPTVANRKRARSTPRSSRRGWSRRSSRRCSGSCTRTSCSTR